MVAPVGALLKYLVWDFLNMPQTMHEKHSGDIAEAQAAIHERKFLPSLVSIDELLASRRSLLPSASLIEILTELPLDSKVKEAMAALSERLEMNQSYEKAAGACHWVAGSWLIVTLCSVGMFFVHYHMAGALKAGLMLILQLLLAVSIGAGVVALGKFHRAQNLLTRKLRSNRL
ncbi:MAG: hypothetical protein WBX38_09515 [Candidatus Sulfotelmatobacter sp.]